MTGQNVGNLNLSLGLDLTALSTSLAQAETMLNKLQQGLTNKSFTFMDGLKGSNADLAQTNQLTSEIKSAMKELSDRWKAIDWSKGSVAQKTGMEIMKTYQDVVKTAGMANMTLEQAARELTKVEIREIKEREAAAKKSADIRHQWDTKRLDMRANYESKIYLAQNKEQESLENKKFKFRQMMIDKKALYERKVFEDQMAVERRAEETRLKWSMQRANIRANQPMSYDVAMSLPSNSITDRAKKIQELRRVQESLNSTDANYASQLRNVNKEMQRLNAENNKAISDGVQLQKQTQQLGTSWAWAARKAALFLSVSTISSFLSKLKDVRGEFEMQQKAFAAIIQNKEAADKIFAQTVRLALQSPYNLRQLITYTRELSAYRVETEKLYDTTKMLADISAGLGVDMSRLILAYGQVRSAAVLRGQELRQFTEAGIPIIAELAEEFGKLENRVVSTGEVFDKVSKREVPFAMVDKIFKKMTTEGGVFYNMQLIQAQTLKGKWSNLQDAYDIMMNSMGERNQEWLEFGVDSARLLVENYHGVITMMKLSIAGFGLYKLGVISASIATNKLGATIIANTGKLAVFNGQTYASVMALKAQEAASVGASVGLLRLQKAALIAKGAMTLLSGTAILLAVTAVVSLIAAISNAIAKAKEFREQMDKENIAILSNAQKVNELIESLKALNKENSNNADSTAKRIELLSQLRKADGDVANAVQDHTSDLEKLTEVQHEYNKQQELSLFLNDLIEKSASQGGGGSKSMVDRIVKLSEAKREEAEANRQINNEWMLARQKLEKIIETGIANKKKISDIDKENIKGVLSIIDKTSEANRAAAGLYKIKEFGLERFGISDPANTIRESERTIKAVNMANTRLKRSTEGLIDELKEYIMIQFPEAIGGSLEDPKINKSIKAVADVLEKAIGDKEYVIKIMAELDIPVWRAVPETLKGWKKAFSDISGLSEETLGTVFMGESGSEATLLGALDKVIEKRKELNEEIDREGKIRGKVGALSEKEFKDKKDLYDSYGKILSFYNQSEKAGKEDDRIKKIQVQIDLYEEAYSVYEKYLDIMSKDAATSKIASVYGGSIANTVSSTKSYEAWMKQNMESLRKIGSEEALKAANDIEKNLRKNQIDLEIGISRESRDTLEKEIAQTVKMFSKGKELSELVGIDKDWIGDIPSSEQVVSSYLSTISELKQRGGKDDLDKAKQLEDELVLFQLERREEMLKNISEMTEEMAAKQHKVLILSNRVALSQVELDTIIAEEKKGVKIDAIKKRFLETYIKHTNKEIQNLNSEFLKSNEVYMKLFGDLSEATVTELVDMVSQMQQLISSAVANEDGGFTISSIDSSGLTREMKISAEAYISVVKKVAEVNKQIEKSSPFRHAGVKFREAVGFMNDYRITLNTIKQLENKLEEDINLTLEDRYHLELAIQDLKNKNNISSEKAVKAAEEGLKAMEEGIRRIDSLVSSVTNLAEMLGASDETLDVLGSIQDGLKIVLGLLVAIKVAMAVISALEKSTVWGWIATIAVVIVSAVASLLKAHDKEMDAQIKSTNQMLDDMNRRTSELQKAMSRAFSMSVYLKDYEAAREALLAQLALTKRLMELEYEKRKTDEDKIRDYRIKIEELNNEIKEFDESVSNSMIGTTLTSAAEEFANAWIDAFMSGEDAMLSFEGKFEDMLKTLMAKQIAYGIMGSILEPFFKKLDGYIGAGSDMTLTLAEAEDLASMIPSLLENLNDTTAAVFVPIMEALGLTKDGLGSISGLQADIEGIREETAGKLVALLNTMRYQMYASAERLAGISDSFSLVTNIGADMLVTQKEMLILMKEIRSWQDSITTSGHIKGGRGLKVFSN